MVFNPTLQASPGFDRPVADNRGEGLSTIASTIFAGMVKPKEPAKPSESEKKGEFLRPLASELERIQNSTMPDSQKMREGRKFILRYTAEFPQYESDIMGLGSSMLGIEGQQPLAVDPVDAQTQFYNERMATPEGQAIFQRNLVIVDGQVDVDATSTAALKDMYSVEQTKLALEESNRSLQRIQNDRQMFITVAKNNADSLMPVLRGEVEKDVNSILIQASQADLSNPNDQLRALRQSATVARTQAINSFVAAGIPQEVYTEYLDDVLQPLNEFIQLAENTRDDIVKTQEAWKAAKEMALDKEFIRVVGPFGGSPDMQKSLIERIANGRLGDQAVKILEVFDNIQKDGFQESWKFLPQISAPTVDTPLADPDAPVANPAAVERSQGKSDARKLDDIQAAALTIEGISNAEGIAVMFGSIVADADSVVRPLSSGVLQQVLSPANMQKLRTQFMGNDPRSVDLKNTFTAFTEKQVEKNIRLVENIMTGQVQNIEDRFKVALVDGKWGLYNLSVSGQWRLVGDRMFTVHKEVRESLERMNTLFTVTDQATNGSYSKLFKERAKGKYDLPDSISGGAGDEEVQGGTGQDVVLEEGTVPYTAYQTMVSKGLPEHVAQGFLMNFQDESGFQEDIVEAVPNVHGTRGKGLYQLTGSRRTAFEKKYGDDWSTANQIDWLIWELNNTEKSARDKIMNTETAGEAAAAIVNHFLRPAEKHRKAREERYLGGAPSVSVRPQARPEPTAPQTRPEGLGRPSGTSPTQDTEMASQPASPSLSNELSVGAATRVGENPQDVVIGEQTRKLMRLLGQDENNIPRFATEEEAIKSGLPDDTVVIVNGELMVL